MVMFAFFKLSYQKIFTTKHTVYASIYSEHHMDVADCVMKRANVVSNSTRLAL